ncbi:MAG: transposase [Candidatus Marinimicrobia bacterium]|nr:transposase [Candidatus Neomarinimicrobiota bacterium]
MKFDKHKGVAPYKRFDDMGVYRNGYSDRNFLKRLGEMGIRLPRDREGNFSTELFSRY